MNATIRHETEESGSELLQVIQLDLSSTGQLPQRIPLQVTAGANLQIRGDLQVESIRKVSSEGLYDNWLLEMPEQQPLDTAVSVILTSPCADVESQPATLLSVPGARLTGGTISPVRIGDWQLENKRA